MPLKPAGGATTGKLLPTGSVVDTLDVPGVGKVCASLVDAANACCFVRAADVGLVGTEMPDFLDSASALLETLGRIRVAASIAMGIGHDEADARRRRAVPYIVMVAPARDSPSLSGEPVLADAVDLTVRALSSGQPHRALPLTVSLCLAVASRMDGTVVHEVASTRGGGQAAGGAGLVRIAMPSGVLLVDADVRWVVGGDGRGAWHAEQGAFYRTQRRLFDGFVYVPAARVSRLVKAS